MRVPFDTVLFDLDGTLSDSKEGIIHSILYALDKLYIKEDNPRKLEAFVGPALRDSFRRYYGMEGEQLEQVVKLYREYFVPKGMFENELYPGIREMLAELKEAGVRIILCTAKPEIYARQILEHFDILRYFDYVKGASLDASLGKKRDIIRCVLDQGWVTGRCAMVGDRRDDLQGARDNEIPGLGVRWGYGLPGEMEGCDPAAIFERVEDLKRFLLGQRGYFITFEGQDGAGKTTQMKRLQQALEERGYCVRMTREPGGCPISEQIRKILLNIGNGEMDGVCEAYLYAAARAQHVRQVIVPALMRGEIVLCDRFIDSSLAYQGAGRGLGVERVAQINREAIGEWMPDLTLYFSLDPESGMQRNATGGKTLDRMEAAGEDFRARVRAGFMELAKGQPGRIRVVDADRSLEDVWQQVLSAVQEYLHLSRT